ncbi:MAG: hypothetical protein RhofKO_17520 [Rhodothermales bacterium]
MMSLASVRLPEGWSVVFVLLILPLSGCFPGSCQREEPRDLFPADSLSRDFSLTVAVDTLAIEWTASETEDYALSFPRTVRFGPDGRLYAADAERQRIFIWTTDGSFSEEWWVGTFESPYLAGWRSDSLVVYNPPALRFDVLLYGQVERSFNVPYDLKPEGLLTWGAADTTGYYFKAVSEDFDGYVAVLDASGQEVERVELPGNRFRQAGLLRTWGDSLLSLSGFRPVADIIRPGVPRDSLAFMGFDSPMLPRSHTFFTGGTTRKGPPLLTASAAPAGPYLFVLNSRPGWLYIDVFDRNGQLQHHIVEPNPQVNSQHQVQDLAAQQRADGTFEIAVVLTSPIPSVTFYTWQPNA